jgi:hypothetical protein
METNCAYCGTPFPYVGGLKQRDTCSAPCAKRLGEWKRWETESRRQVILGDVTKPAKVSPLRNGVAVAEAVSLFVLAG